MDKEVEIMLNNIQYDLKGIRNDIKDNEGRIRVLETRNTINEQNIKTLTDDVKSIKNNTTWILRLVVGSIIGALLTMMIKGG